jgi:ParB-like chromosome segregation protein Spo0J
MCASIREFGFKIPVLARSDGTVVDGHLRLKSSRKLGSWPGGDTTCIPVILCDEWSEAQVKAFRLLVNRSVAWADWDEELLALELQELSEADFDLSLTGFDPGEIDGLLSIPDEEKANEAPRLQRSLRLELRRVLFSRRRHFSESNLFRGLKTGVHYKVPYRTPVTSDLQDAFHGSEPREGR